MLAMTDNAGMNDQMHCPGNLFIEAIIQDLGTEVLASRRRYCKERFRRSQDRTKNLID